MGIFAPKNIFPCTTCPTTGGGEVVSNFLTLKVPVKKEELALLNSNPVVLIPDPGPGFAILPINIATNYIYGTEDYDYNAASPYIIIKNAANTGVIASLTDLIAVGPFVNLFTLQASNAYSSVPNSGIVPNQELQLTCQHDAIAGNGSLDVYINYIILSV